jgi:hypothetical protein
MIKKNDTNLIITELIETNKKTIKNIQDKINILSNDELLIPDNRSKKFLADKKSKLERELIRYTLETIKPAFYDELNISNITELSIVDRYCKIINDGLDSQNLCYLDGWNQFFDKNFDKTSLPVKLVNYQLEDYNINDEFKTKIKLILPFYEKNYSIIRDYFEKKRYFNKNEVIKFVYDLLLHLTKTVICSMIETIIKKVLFEYINQIEVSPVDFIFDKVEYIFNPIKDHLYDIIPKIFVSNSVDIYKDIDDTLNKETQTVSMVLNNLLDLLKSSSPIEIDEYTINLLKNNFVMYFDTIVWKTINNWNVVIENIFMFHINQYRILECIHRLLN